MTSERLTYQHRHLGLDHDRFSHEPTHARAPVSWPEGKPLALWISVPVEFFPLDAPAVPVKPLGGLDRGYPDFWSYSNRDYGLRIGIYRVMQALDALGLRACALMNAAIANRTPRVFDEVVRRRWEVVASGLDMGQVHHGKLDRAREHDMVRQTRETLSAAVGQPIRGWHSPGHAQSANTLDLIAECGFDYVTDWANDDMPYDMRTPAGPLRAMPLAYELSDRVLILQHNLTVEAYEALVMRAFARLTAEAARHGSGRLLSLSISPWIMGYPHRIATLERLLGRIIETGSVWPATGAEIVDQIHAQSA